jgi:3alpha(or 20beta)-hydroxysteroid dehydrogenase
MGKLDGKVAFITGAAAGMGAADARLFAAEGARVVLTDVADEAGKDVANEIGERAAYFHLDVSQEEEWAEVLAMVGDQFGPPTVLVNNAGILKFSPLASTSLDEYLQVIQINQVGVFLGMRAVLDGMMAAGGGSIINVSSIEGMFGGPGLTAYAASKFAVRGMTKVAAVELGSFGIRVNSIHPGAIDTPMTRQAGMGQADVNKFFGRTVPLKRAGLPEDVARVVLFLASDDSAYCTGTEFVVDGGATAYINWTGSQRPPV